MNIKKVLKWLWNEDHWAAWWINVFIAFIIIKFLVYPGLAAVTGSSFPVVAVVSESMEHDVQYGSLCGYQMEEFPSSYDTYWSICGEWYEKNGITKETFADFPLHNGFNKGDIIVLARADNVEVGDVLVFWSYDGLPIIHRVVDNSNGYTTKGDHNADSFGAPLGEINISEDRVIGKAVGRIPYLGYIKIVVTDILVFLGILAPY